MITYQRYLKTVPLSKKFSYYSCNFSDATPIKLPPQLKRFEIEYTDESFELDASDCTQLSYL